MSRLVRLWKELGYRHADEFDMPIEDAVRNAVLAVVWLLLLIGEVTVVAVVVPS